MPTPPRHPKPDKPWSDFPLFAHRNGQWAKKIRGKIHYFGKWADSDAALVRYLERKDYLHAGMAPPTAGLTVRDVANAFMDSQDLRLQTGEIAPTTHQDYLRVSKLLTTQFDRTPVSRLLPPDWSKFRAAISDVSPHTINRRITTVRLIFRWAYESMLLDRPMRFGPDFKFASKRARRQHDHKQPSRLLSAEEIRVFIDAANPHLKCWILFGINCGFYSSDLAAVERRHIDGEFIDFPRPKTEIERRCWLWPETREAMTVAQPSGLLFVSSRGNPLNVSYGKSRTDIVKNQWSALKQKLKVARPGGFSCLRHTHRTVADECGDQPAANYSMGHSQNDMADQYRHKIDDKRLIQVAEHVRAWLFEKKV